ncbi:MAG: hypothetical protein AB1758_14380, partial [Candidatus Eremiobacterota bacterium]
MSISSLLMLASGSTAGFRPGVPGPRVDSHESLVLAVLSQDSSQIAPGARLEEAGTRLGAALANLPSEHRSALTQLYQQVARQAPGLGLDPSLLFAGQSMRYALEQGGLARPWPLMRDNTADVPRMFVDGGPSLPAPMPMLPAQGGWRAAPMPVAPGVPFHPGWAPAPMPMTPCPAGCPHL